MAIARKESSDGLQAEPTSDGLQPNSGASIERKRLCCVLACYYNVTHHSERTVVQE